MLTTAERVTRVPGLNNAAQLPLAWLQDLIGEADAGVKLFLKRDIELSAYEECYSGDSTRDIVIRQTPVLFASTTTTASGNLPTGTLAVASTAGFHPGIGGASGSPPYPPSTNPPSIAVQTGVNSFSRVTYTGATSTTFTGCSGGAGSFASGARVFSPIVWFDPGGFGGQAPGGFADGTILAIGSQYYVVPDGGAGAPGRKSGRGLIRRIGGAGAAWVGFYPETLHSGKLGASRLPMWPRGDSNIKVAYSAGFESSLVPLDIVNATTQLVAYLVRNTPKGAPLSSESLGAYSYSVLSSSNPRDNPEIGSIVSMLSRHRESSWGL